MALVFEQMNIPDGWSKAYISQLAEYVRHRDIDEYYYGNKKQYEKRHKAILEWIETYERFLYDTDDKVVFNKKKDKQ